MKLRLPGEAKAGPGIERRVRRATQLQDARQAGSPGGVSLAIEQVGRLALREKEIPIDAVDRRGMTLGRTARSLGSVKPLDIEVSIVDRIRQMRARSRRLASADVAI